MTNCLVEKELKTVIEKHKCTNCMACLNTCPVKAIEMKEDKEGFSYPVINEEKCIKCGLCAKKCPALNVENDNETIEKLETPIAYGAYIKDEEIREKSSSGGVFSALADYVLDKGGCVCGAKFIKGGILEHVIIDKKEDLAPLRGSKYVQSHVNDCFSEIKTLLNNDKHVLFVGTPCQVAGLYAVLDRDYENLITVDLLCHGTPSQKIFREYLNEITDGREDLVTNINFRDKEKGWRSATLKFDCEGEEFKEDYYATPYGLGFIANLTIRKSCTNCKFNGIPRPADITIGDLWGVENCDKSLDDNKGISGILANTEKAKKVIFEIQDSFEKFKEIEHKYITQVNMVNKKSYNHFYRDYFFERYSNGDYESISDLINECLKKNDGVAVFNYSFSKDNYGSVLTGYALQKKIKSLGYTPVNINLPLTKPTIDIADFEDFAFKNIAHTKLYSNTQQLKELNKHFKTFIVGPDCMWHQMNVLNDFYNTYFNFVNLQKTIASYASSFCYKDPIRIIKSAFDHHERRRLIRRFDFVGVREKSGIDNCAKLFDTEATNVLDAVFLIDRDEWQKLADTSEEKYPSDYPVKFLFNEDQFNEDLMDEINNLENLVSLYNGEPYWKRFLKIEEFKIYKKTKVVDWLKGIANSNLVITDSYHGMCFAILFRKQFILLNKKEAAQERHIALCELLGIKDRFAQDEGDIERLKNEIIDYAEVDRIIEKEAKKSEEFLLKILHYEKENKNIINMLDSLENVDKDLSNRISATASKNGKVVYVNNLQTQQAYHPRKTKWYFLGIQVFKEKTSNGKTWFYVLGVPLVRKVQKAHKTYYKLFGFINVVKKAVFD